MRVTLNFFRPTGFIFQPNRHLLLQQVTKHAGYVRGKTLDVGCGPTPRYRHLFKECSEYVKMDIFESEHVDVVGHAESMPFPDAAFDSIVCTETLQDVFEPIKGMMEISRVLKKSGIVLLSVPAISRQSDSPTDNWRFTRHSLKRIIEETGFKIEVMEQRGAYWSTMSQLKVAYWIRRLGAYKKWYARFFEIGASMLCKFAIWLDGFEKEPVKSEFTNGYFVIARKN